MQFRHLPVLMLVALLAIVSACSTKKNTGATRWWHSFTARYNTYFNGHEAFLDGEKAKEDGHTDDYTEFLPVFLVSSEKSRTVGKSNFETTIEKCEKAIQLHSIKKKPVLSANKKRTPKVKAYLSRQEFNPFLKNAWLLMGKAQFEKGEFLEAASTFSYITRFYAPEPDVVAEARQWLARCYAQIDWFYDAEDALTKVRRDSLSKDVAREADATQADLLLRQERFEEALPYLISTAKHKKGKLQRARMYFLLGQVNQHLGNLKEAYKAYGKVIKLSPPYELAFNARIKQTEVLGTDAAKSAKMVKKLKRMARSENNKTYLDQVYYAMGNIYLARLDTTEAISAFEKGRAKATRNGVEKGVLLLRLGGLYWDMRKFDKAQECYNEALGLLDKSREGYDELTRRTKVLDKLVPYTSAVHLQDSLQELSRMSEEDRNAAIDRVIEALKKKEEEQRKAAKDSAAQARMSENSGNDFDDSQSSQTTDSSDEDADWYFYNTPAITQGKQDFQKKWGSRKNEDNWRRSNKTVLADIDDEGYDYEAEDSLAALVDSLGVDQEELDEKGKRKKGKKEELAPEDDPHQREYYLAQIPFSDEAKAASDDIIMDGLFNAGIIEKDDLEDLPLANETLTRLVTYYPDFEKMAEAYYHLFLLYSRWGKPEDAEWARNMMISAWPENELTKTIAAPDFELMARWGKQIEDSLYTATYTAYRNRDNATVERNFRTSTEKFPKGDNRPKFLFIHALSRLTTATTKELIEELKSLVKDFPNSDVSQLAGMIVKGLESGRQIGSGTFDLGSLWGRRTAAADSTSLQAAQQRVLSEEQNVPFLFVLAYPADSLDTNKLLYEIAYFNFTTFVVRGFDMSIVQDEGITQFRVSGFNSYEEAHAYAQKLFATTNLSDFLEKGRALIISKANLELIGTKFSYDDYRQFYDETFAPMELNPELPIEQNSVIKQHYEDEYTPEQLKRMNRDPYEGDFYEDEEEFYEEPETFEDVELEEQEISVPEETFEEPEQEISVPEETFEEPEQEISIPEETFEEPEQEISVLEETFEEPEQELSVPEETFEEPEQEISTPQPAAMQTEETEQPSSEQPTEEVVVEEAEAEEDIYQEPAIAEPDEVPEEYYENSDAEEYYEEGVYADEDDESQQTSAPDNGEFYEDDTDTAEEEEWYPE